MSLKNVQEQLKQLKHPKTLAMLGLLLALGLVVAQINIVLTPTLMISFTYLISAICSYMFGPVIGGLYGFLSDNLKFFLSRSSGPYCPLFAINEILAGIIYGIFFYKKKVNLKKAFMAYGIVCLGLNILLNPLWMHLLFNKGYWFYVGERAISNIILYPLKAILLYWILNKVKKLKLGGLKYE